MLNSNGLDLQSSQIIIIIIYDAYSLFILWHFTLFSPKYNLFLPDVVAITSEEPEPV